MDAARHGMARHGMTECRVQSADRMQDAGKAGCSSLAERGEREREREEGRDRKEGRRSVAREH